MISNVKNVFLIVLLCCSVIAAAGRKPVKKSRPSHLVVVSEQKLAPGIRYTHYRTKSRRSTHIHELRFNRTEQGGALCILKGRDWISGREPLASLTRRYSDSNGREVFGAINANFWSGGRSIPIGPLVADGQVVQMLPYKQWSSAFFDKSNAMVIDTFRLRGILVRGSDTLSISSVNSRFKPFDIVFYNLYAGPSVPFIPDDWVESALHEAMVDTTLLGNDSTEQVLDTAQMREDLRKMMVETNREHATKKLVFRYLHSPCVNAPVPALLIAVDTGVVAVPDSGFIITVSDSVYKLSPLASWSVGDTTVVHFSTNVHSKQVFVNAVSGTPRLVRNGKASPEAAREGVTSKRFINRKLARTAIGVDKSGRELIFAVIEPGSNGNAQEGATLLETARFMKMLGAYQAMNLDGGGSSGMVVENSHVIYKNEDPVTRSISVALGLIRAITETP